MDVGALNAVYALVIFIAVLALVVLFGGRAQVNNPHSRTRR